MRTLPNDHINNIEYGLTKREYFAALAMQGLLSNSKVINPGGALCITKSEMMGIAVISANVLIEELNKEKK